VSRIDDIFATLRPVGYKAIMPFVCAGHPKPGQLAPILRAAEQAGCAIAEIGIPFSDPIADGPVIAAAMHEALQAGVTPASVFEEVKALRPTTGLGLIAMVSVSIVHRMGGPDAFATKAKDAGFDGLIVPDAPLEESGALRNACKAKDLAFSLMIAPTTPPPRAEEIARQSLGFIYLLARTGITGEQQSVPDIGPRVAALRAITSLPIACGFGISTAEHVAAVVKHADAAIVGSALVRRLSEASKHGRPIPKEAGDFLANLAQGLSTQGTARV
jgi:tryptophan synthase alpha chain